MIRDRLDEYFASEASEYLDQLERLLAVPGVPEIDQLLRLATGVRGSARMAGASTVARVAERLEDAVRSIISGNIAWSEEIRGLSQQTVGDLKLLVRALNRWGQEEERRVRDALLRWGGVDVESPPGTDAVPIEALFYDDEGPHVIAIDGAAPAVDTVDAASQRGDAGKPRVPSSSGVMDVGLLLFRGERALREALSRRAALEQAIGDGGSRTAAQELVDEIFDLIELGLSSAPPEA